MDLGKRIEKIATGVSVADAIRAYVKRRTLDGEAVDPVDEERQEVLAIVEVMFLMAAVDGHISDVELMQMAASVQALRDIHSIEGLDLKVTLDQLNQALADDGWTERVHRAASRLRTPDARTFAFRLAAAVAFVDDHVRHAEAAALANLQRELGLEKREADALLEDVHEMLFG